jgi:hypothetical protein
MPLVKPAAQPGFQSQATQVQAQGSWYAGNLVRWRNGLLEKMGGWKRMTHAPFAAVIRKMHAWTDLENYKNLLVGGDFGVGIVVQDAQYGLGRQVALNGGYILEIGPTGNETTFSVTSGSTTVTVNTTAIATVGGTFLLELPISIGGRTILASTFFTVKDVIPGTGFTFDIMAPALVTETGTYGLPLLDNNIVNVMTVTWKAHGFSPGSQIKFAQATKVRAGASGTWEIVNFTAPAETGITVDTVVDADHFTFQMGTLGTGNGGGTAAQQVYVGCSADHPTGGLFTTSVGTVIGLALQEPLGNPQTHSWFLTNLGEDGLVLRTGGPLEVYHPPIENGPFLTPVGAGSPATAPQNSNGMFVAMPQAQVVLWGTEPIMGSGVIDPLLLRWSDAGSFDEYLATVSNQAGSFRLSRGSRIMGAIQAPQITFIVTDTDLWGMSYIGPPLIYGFTIMGTGCGLVAPNAINTMGRVTVWQGEKNFWQVGDTGVQPLPCTVWDYIFEDIDKVNIHKCFAAPNSSTNEMAFYFPSQRTLVGESGNLLEFSQLFSNLNWMKDGAAAQKVVIFTPVYVYEPQYVNIGWFDDSGLPPISWLNADVQGIRKDVTIPFAPDLTDTAFDLVELPVNGPHSIFQRIDKAGLPITFTYSVYAHSSSTRNLTLRAVTEVGSVFATFNVSSGAVVTSGVTSPRFSLLGASVLTDTLGLGSANGWRRYVMTFTSDNAPSLDLYINLTNGIALSYLGVPPNRLVIWGAQLVFGNMPLDYQPTTGVLTQNENTRYVKINFLEPGPAWDSGELWRSAWIDNSIWGTPLGADKSNLIQQHEVGFDADDQPMRGVFAETGYTELGDGSVMLSIDHVEPDLKWFGKNGGVKIKLKAKNYAQGPEHYYGPWSMTPGTQYFAPRVRTKYVAQRYEWEPVMGFSARLGVTTFRVKPAGRRP